MSEVTVWNKILRQTFKIPFVRVDRDSFLRKELSSYVTTEQMEYILENGPIGVIPPKTLEKIANGSIKFHLRSVSLIAFAAGIPGGFALLGTIPADIAQFFGHIFAVMQKLLYLYGFPSITDDEGNIDDETLHYITLFIGVMFGSSTASKASNMVLEQLAKGMQKKLARVALTRTSWFPILKEIGKWVNIKITRDVLKKTTGKVLPILGGPINATFTYFTFKPMAKKLHKHLQERLVP